MTYETLTERRHRLVAEGMSRRRFAFNTLVSIGGIALAAFAFVSTLGA